MKKPSPNVPDLMGFAEVCEELGVRPSNLQFVRDLPEPVAHVRATTLWLAADIKAFAREYKARRKARRARVTALTKDTAAAA